MIEVKNLKKSFGPKVAVNDISFSVRKGEVLGFLGPNGAGKSTTMRMVTGYLTPSEGTITVGGHDVVKDPIAVKSQIGYLPENAPSYSDMTVLGFLNFTAEIRGLDGEARKRAVNRVVEMCFLQSVVHQSIDTLSKGFRHRTCFAQSIIHDPPVLVLDEPTDGLDPNQKQEVRNLIRRMGQEKAIIFSTHILEEVEAVCSRAIIIDRGKVVANGTPAELKRKSDTAGTVSLKVGGISPEDAVAKLSSVAEVEKTALLEKNGAFVHLRVYPKNGVEFGSLARTIAGVTVRENWIVEELHTEEGRLDEVFRGITMSDTNTEVRS